MELVPMRFGHPIPMQMQRHGGNVRNPTHNNPMDAPSVRGDRDGLVIGDDGMPLDSGLADNTPPQSDPDKSAGELTEGRQDALPRRQDGRKRSQHAENGNEGLHTMKDKTQPLGA